VSDNAGSARVRGHQVAAPLGGTCLLKQLSAATVTVFVKRLPSQPILEAARTCSQFLVFDPVDNYKFDKMRHLPVDGAIASNEGHARHLRQTMPGATVVVIPHHHCVLDGVQLDGYPGDRGIAPGYVGDIDNLAIPARELSSRFDDFVLDSDVGALRRIGIGIAYREDATDMEYKSGIKLANYWAHGIAPVCSPDASYLEMGQDGSNMLVAYSKGQLLDAVRMLREDKDMRVHLAENGFRHARRYNLEYVVEMYYTLLGRMRSGEK
jgi:hypothetical protein